MPLELSLRGQCRIRQGTDTAITLGQKAQNQYDSDDRYSAGVDREQPPSLDIVITVRPDGSVRLNREPVAVTELRQRLMLLFRTAPDHVVFVRGEKGLEFRTVAEVIDIANGEDSTAWR
jgi:biopolymer transport protein ExbD